MPGFPGSPNILKGAFVRYDGTKASPRIIVFPYNPETLYRTILPGPVTPQAGQPEASASDPLETIVFTLTLDATDALGQGDAQAATIGVYPVLSAIELLMYPPAQGSQLVTLFIWGPSRIVPVRVTALSIMESLFDPNLSPIQATVQATLTVTPADDIPNLGYLLEHIGTLNAMAALGYSSSPVGTGVTLPVPGAAPASAQAGTVLGGAGLGTLAL